MTRRHSVRIALALLAATGVQVAHATPRRATAEVRAASCCRAHCRHAGSMNDAGRCCEVRNAGGEPALLPAAGRAPAAPPAALPSAVPDAARPRARAVTPARVLCRSGPLFLLTGTLRL